MKARRDAPKSSHLVSRPQSRGGCRSPSHGGSRRADRFPESPGISMGRPLLRFRAHPGDERGPGHQIEYGIFQYRALGSRHMALKRHSGAPRRRRCRYGNHIGAGVPDDFRKVFPDSVRNFRTFFGKDLPDLRVLVSGNGNRQQAGCAWIAKFG